jgi:alanyl-tRNA synthetase
MIDIKQEYINFCTKKGIKITIYDSIKSHDDTTLFCPAGMQAFKSKFKDKNHKGTEASIQACLRINDLNEISDSTHALTFDMLGLFSFREMTMKEAIDFWLEFITDVLKLRIDYVTYHPHKFEWVEDFYWEGKLESHDVRREFQKREGTDDQHVLFGEDKECIWTDGELKGYCTEFYINFVEIGNIVNLEEDCIDVGFGFDRLDELVNGAERNKIKNLKKAILKLIDEGFIPSNTKQGYVLRKLLRELYLMNDKIDHEFFEREVERQIGLEQKYYQLRSKNLDKSKEWWKDTHGIDLDLINEL